MCNQFRIRRPDTWRHRASDHSTRQRTLPIHVGDPFGTVPLSPALFEILASKCIGVTTLTFQGHVTSSVTWPFDSQWVISYWWSFFGPKLGLSLKFSEIFRLKHHVLIGTMLVVIAHARYHVICTPYVNVSTYFNFSPPLCLFNMSLSLSSDEE